MIERVTCPCMHNPEDEPIAEYTNGSSFKLSYHFYPINQPGAQIRLGSFDLSVDYWIYGYEDNKIHFDKPSITNSECIVEDRFSTIKFLFKNYTLNTGKLYARYTFTIPDLEMGYVTDVVEGYTGIIIK